MSQKNSSDDTLPLAEVGQALRKIYGRGESYARIHRAVAGGQVPAIRSERGWVIQRSDIAVMAAHLGITTTRSQG
jgi:hypothetical protein